MADESLQERRYEKQQDQRTAGLESILRDQEARTQDLVTGMASLWTPMIQTNLAICKGLVDAGQAMLIGFEVMRQNQQHQKQGPTQGRF